MQNLGNDDRRVRQRGAGRAQKAANIQHDYVEFILKLYGAKPVTGYAQGIKAGRMVHVGSVDAPVSIGDVTQIAAEFKKAIGTGKDAPTTNGVGGSRDWG